MSVLNDSDAFRKAILGNQVSKSITVSGAATQAIFTIAGGLVAVTSIVGRVTTAITVAGTSKLQHNPTAGTTVDLCAATDLGTTDTVLGEILVIDGLKTSTLVLGALAMQKFPILMDTGQIEQVTATGGDGTIKWYCTWVPMDAGATLVAA
jgi:hypothetical protein